MIGRGRRRLTRVGRWRAIAWLALSAAALACGGREASQHEGPPPRQALVLLLDAARADRFSAYGYGRATTPRLDELAKRGVVFTRCFAHATQTRASLSNLFYSRYFAVPLIPENPRIPLVSPDDLFRTLDPEAISLPRALAAAGIPTAGVSAHSWIRADSGLAAEFDEFHDLSATLRFPPYQHYPNAEQVVDWLIDWLDGHHDRDFFLYVHLMDTHFPHGRGPEARSFFDGVPDTPELFDEMGRPRDTSTALRGRDRAHLDALYDGSLHFADRQVGRLVDHLAAAGRLETMVIVVTADHGEELLEHADRFGHGGPWRDVLGRVPLIVHAPGRVPPARVDALVEHVDVAPTVLGLLDVSLPPGKRFDGVDLATGGVGETRRPHVVMPHGIRSETWKARFPGESPLVADAVPVELYDLAADPLETRDVAGEHADVAAALTARFRERLRDPWARWQATVTNVTPRSAFAIAASQMRVTPAVPVVDGHVRLVDLTRAVDDAHGWVQATGGNRARYALVGRAGAPPITLEIAVPDGEYRVHLAMRGAARIDVAGGPREVAARSAAHSRAEPESLHDVEPVDIGVVRVTDRRFRATLQPLPEAPWLLVRTFGFEPVGAPAIDPAAAREREERLRGLGYVE